MAKVSIAPSVALILPQNEDFVLCFLGAIRAGVIPVPIYPPMALDETNPNNIAFGTDRINLDAAQGTGGWPTKVSLPGITGNVSALHYVNSDLLYVGTTTGKVYRLARSGANWTATALSAAPLPWP